MCGLRYLADGERIVIVRDHEFDRGTDCRVPFGSVVDGAKPHQFCQGPVEGIRLDHRIVVTHDNDWSLWEPLLQATHSVSHPRRRAFDYDGLSAMQEQSGATTTNILGGLGIDE